MARMRLGLGKTLEAANAALAIADHGTALTLLIDAWAHSRNTRIAELVEQVSASAAPRPAIQGKTVAASLAAWYAVEQNHDLLDVERLLAFPWPAKWRERLPMLQRIVTWPDDPRVGRALSQLLVHPPYTSAASLAFWHALTVRLLDLDDARAREPLQAHVERQARRSAAYRTLQPKLATLRTADAPLDDDVAASLAQLERWFVSTVRNEGTKKKTRADFLAAIWAEPDNRSLKSVFADWLTEHGDPRGELISLGLARETPSATSQSAQRRVRSLIADLSVNHDAWDWPVVTLFDRKSLRYEAGFFAGGLLLREPDATEADHPAWSHVRVIELGDASPRNLEFFMRKSLRLRALYNLDEEAARSLLSAGALRHLEALEVTEDARRETFGDDDPLASALAAPALRSFGVCCAHFRHTAALRIDRWPVVQRVEKLTLRDGAHHVAPAAMLAGLSTLQRPLEVEFRKGYRTHFLTAEPTFSFVRRGGERAFGALTARPPPDEVFALARLLGELPVGSLHQLRLDLGRRELSVDEAKAVVEQLARFPDVVTDPPLAPLTPPPSAAATEPTLLIDFVFEGTSLCTPELVPRALALAAELGLSFDSFKVGYGSRRKLGPKPAQQLATWAKKKSHLRLFTDGGLEDFTLGKGSPARSDLAGAISHERARHLVAFLASLCDEFELQSGAVVVNRFRAQVDDTFGLWCAWPGWLLIASGHWCEWLTDSGLGSLRAAPELEGLFFKRTTRNLLIGLTPTPFDTPSQSHLEAFTVGMERLVDDEWARRRGYRWAEFGEKLAATASSLGLNDQLTSKASLNRFRTVLGGHRRLCLEIRNPFGAPTLHAALQFDVHVGFRPHELGEFPVGDAALAQGAITEIARLAHEQGREFFAEANASADE